jgi:hypothetical protein
VNANFDTLLSDCSGYCRECDAVHSLGEGRARKHARGIMDGFARRSRLDYDVPAEAADPRLDGRGLWAGMQGQMYGVLDCETPAGDTVVLRSFSSLPGGVRWVPGWVPPLLDRETHEGVVLRAEHRIKDVTRRLEEAAPGSRERGRLAARRRELSRRLMDVIHDRYRLLNFRGRTRSIREAFGPGRGIPGGVGECCAPKLLTHAARRGLRPRGIAEFYWGEPGPSGSRRPGKFYPSCFTRCRPILGFLLCGIE